MAETDYNILLQRLKGGQSARLDTKVGKAVYLLDPATNTEHLIYGDTGTRDLKATAINGWVVDIIRIRRVLNTVYMSMYNFNHAAKTAEPAIPIPLGYQPSIAYQGNLTFPCRMEANALGWLTVRNTDKTLLPEPSARSFVGAIGTIQWHTEDAWPTVLPGTPT